jgi:hypothetical protein
MRPTRENQPTARRAARFADDVMHSGLASPLQSCGASQGYALTHYITSANGSTAIPTVWGCLFDRVITRVAPDQNEDLWRQLSEPINSLTRLITSARHDLIESVAQLRLRLAVTGAKWLQGRGEALNQSDGMRILRPATMPGPKASRRIQYAEAFRLKAA